MGARIRTCKDCLAWADMFLWDLFQIDGMLRVNIWLQFQVIPQWLVLHWRLFIASAASQRCVSISHWTLIQRSINIWNHEMSVFSFPFTLKFGTHVCSINAEAFARFQCNMHFYVQSCESNTLWDITKRRSYQILKQVPGCHSTTMLDKAGVDQK